MSDIPPSERVRDAWESWTVDRQRAAIRAVLHRVVINPLPAGSAVQPRREAQGPGHPPRTRNGDPAAAGRIRLARVAITPRTQAAETSQAIVSAASCSCRWCARAARSFVARRQAGSTQECGEHRDRCRVLNALRETVLGSGAPRIVRAGLPDRGALLVAHGLPGGATVRARPVRPSRRRCTRVTGRRAREARDGTTPGTVTHRDRSPGLRAGQCPPLTPIARPAPACCRRCR